MRTTSSGAWILRAGFFVLSVGLSVVFQPFGAPLLRSVLPAALLALLCLLFERILHNLRLATLIAGTLGLVLGLCLGALIVSLVDRAIPVAAGPFFRLFLPLATGFLGLAAGSGRTASFEASWRGVFGVQSPSTAPSRLRYLDSSALIDGRIADLADAGFLDGLLVIPQFVLNELQTVADAADGVKRNRGRRGLGVVARLQKAAGIRVEISPVDYADLREVDWKLIEAAKDRDAQIVTTDFNLSKLAQVQGIRVLNVNELAVALRPAVLQGETMHVCIAKEGKEPTQGVAYLEDGTMVVVDNARRHVGKTIDILVTGIVQSATGKMIFGRYETGRSSS